MNEIMAKIVFFMEKHEVLKTKGLENTKTA
jgi:hypothetical protein